jgi:hypothetical protein
MQTDYDFCEGNMIRRYKGTEIRDQGSGVKDQRLEIRD